MCDLPVVVCVGLATPTTSMPVHAPCQSDSPTLRPALTRNEADPKILERLVILYGKPTPLASTRYTTRLPYLGSPSTFLAMHAASTAVGFTSLSWQRLNLHAKLSHKLVLCAVRCIALSSGYLAPNLCRPTGTILLVGTASISITPWFGLFLSPCPGASVTCLHFQANGCCSSTVNFTVHLICPGLHRS
jgi:hypothetical protein